MSLKGLVDKIMGRSVADLAAEVDAALGRLAQAQGLEQECMDALRLAQNDVKKAEAEAYEARDALFEAHPRLLQNQQVETYLKVSEGQDMSNHQHDPAWDPTPIEVDDEQDSRFTAGASPISPSDSDPLPPIVWEEHDE